ncbi:MAG: hypothetical protein R3F54_09650 [Alphaproteobacteria bacterium]
MSAKERVRRRMTYGDVSLYLDRRTAPAGPNKMTGSDADAHDDMRDLSSMTSMHHTCFD